MIYHIRYIPEFMVCITQRLPSETTMGKEITKGGRNARSRAKSQRPMRKALHNAHEAL